ncbi:MAG: Flp pilus assembly complex ATPase component TadA [Planctomycetes bacterium]|nr:Flp pilus assembly complex ATPase component TadA [Planctomycetota bacterium]
MIRVEAKELLKALHKMEEVDQATAQKIYNNHRKNNVDIIEACKAGGIREDAVLYAVAQLLGMDSVQLGGMVLPPALIEKVPAHVANSYRIIPVRMEDKTLVIATADPDNLAAMDDLKFMLGVSNVRSALTSESAITEALEQYYQSSVDEDKKAELDKLMNSLGNEESSQDPRGGQETFSIDVNALAGLDTSDVNAAAESAPVRKLLNLILLTGVKAQAADIHFEPFEEVFRVRNRIDGVLYEMLPVPKNLSAPLVARIKVMAHLDISERRMPQDGKIPVKIGDREVDLRVSCLPTMFGESVVIRILDRQVVNLDLDKVGFPDELLVHFKKVIERPNGIVVVTGPTGSGKTTTLYSALSAVNEDSVKIITTEEPVEYEINGLIQVPVDESVGRSFAQCLRAILRQDPDILLVGEVRDQETAKIAIEASLTGHLVFTTLHTNDAPTAVTRLLDMGLEPFLLAATLETILAQRLVRTICPKCKAPYQPSDEELLSLNIRREGANQRFYYGKGCDHCKGTGYKGRTALFELFDINDTTRELILGKATATQLRIAAGRAGMRTLRDSGIQKIFAGLTTIEEVVKETLAAED